MSENGPAIADDCSCQKIERVVEPKENFGKAESPSKRDNMSFDQISESAKYLKEKIRLRPKIGVICGTGLAGLVNILGSTEIVEYSDIPHFPQSTVVGHKSRLVFGRVSDIPVMLMQGRFHHYEGYPIQMCGMPVRVMKLFGIEAIIVSNAAGGLNPAYKNGDVMILKDHINIPGFSGLSPLRGANDTRLGDRFLAMNNCYDRAIRKMANAVTRNIKEKTTFHEGTYAMLCGPNFETIAELRMLKVCGVDAVGMSTCPEVIVARHCGIRVFAFSLITNECDLEENSDETLNHEEVVQAGKDQEHTLQEFVASVIKGIDRMTMNGTRYISE